MSNSESPVGVGGAEEEEVGGARRRVEMRRELARPSMQPTEMPVEGNVRLSYHFYFDRLQRGICKQRKGTCGTR